MKKAIISLVLAMMSVAGYAQSVVGKWVIKSTSFISYKIIRKRDIIPVLIRSANMAPMIGTMRNGLTV